MDTLSYKTVSATPNTIDKKWVVVDANDQIVGRLASKVAMMLRGKHKVNFTPNLDCGDNVIIINAEKVRFTGKKLTDKVYVHHTGYPGGQRFATPKDLLARKPEAVIREAVRRMLPKTRLGNKLYSNLYVYAGPEHPHQAQSPVIINLNEQK
ncbi:MAG: 50S ribosomal protein L13 [Bacteroidales bacterium]|nr:50S ribosomal protein L13 [Bacteroidales bacterium]MDY5823927.1 50S ribosomal protein L13 [Candidatus Coprenecus sp.]